MRHGLEVLNTPTTAYTFCVARERNDIDVTLFKGRGCRADWAVMDGWSFSDHSPIIIKMRSLVGEGGVPGRKTTRWFADSCDWE